MALSLDDWRRKFLAIGIEATSCDTYAKSFSDAKLHENDLPKLDKETLRELGVDTLGHILRIMEITAEPTPQAPPTAISQTVKVPEARAPKVSLNMTHPQWRKFVIDWGVFTSLTKLPDNQYHNQIYSCCSDDVQSAIINTNPKFFELPKEEILKAIQQIVTQRSNPAVHRVHFAQLKQGEGETIKDFAVRLKSTATDCEFACDGCKKDLSPSYIKDQLIKGIANENLQTNILSKAEELDTLEKVIKHAEAYESALKDQNQLNATDEVQATSQYQRMRRNYPRSSPKPNPQRLTPPSSSPRTACTGCGSSQHGIPGTPGRASRCPAWGKTCNSCSLPNHFATVCMQPKSKASEINNLVAHVMFQPDGTYTSLKPSTEEITAYLTPFSPRPDPRNPACIPSGFGGKMKVFPDSGASICLAGPQHLAAIGVGLRNLIKCHKVVKAVGGSILTCYGYLPTDIKVGNNVTRQAVYICNKIDRFYVSRAACLDLQILPQSFPHPMPMNLQAGDVHGINDSTTPELKASSTPRQLPFAPTEKNIPLLKQYLLDHFDQSAFSSNSPFPAISGPPAHIHLQENPIPKARHCPIPVPLHMKQAVKDSLDRDVERGIIAPVPINTPTEWCSTMVVTPKKDGSPRRTVDYQYLNSQCNRETHHVESAFNLAAQVPAGTKKTVLDATDGYHSVPLDEESQHLTTFITEWGRYMYLRMPQGYLASGDAYTRRYDDVISSVPRKVKKVDDTLLWDKDIESAFWHTFEYLELCANNGIVLNKEKFQFCQDSVTFAGLNIDQKGISPTKDMLTSINEFPSPKSVTDARSWFGLINQVAWAYSLSPVMAPFRELLKPNAQFKWDDTLEKAFKDSKQTILSLVKEGITSFDIKKTTCLAPDWSKEGMGFLLLQKYCKCELNKAPVCCPDGWRLVFAGSKFCTPAESRYAPIEGEAAAIAWSLEKARMFTQGCPHLIVVTDHEPLLNIFSDRELSGIHNPRLFKLKQKTLRYRFSIQHNPGKWHRGSDAMSRNPPTSTIRAISDMCTRTSLDDIRTAGSKDPQYTALINTLQAETGFPASRQNTEPLIQPFYDVRHKLSIHDNIIFLDSRIVIPETLRHQVLQNLHSAHQGIDGMRKRANLSIYWPGLDKSIRDYRDKCATCTQIAPSQSREPITLTPMPQWPFQHLSMDMFTVSNNNYLVCVDRFSGWPILYHLPSGHSTSEHIISICRSIFITYGSPEELSTDGGPAFTSSAFRQFLSTWGVSHRLSSAEYPQSNGRAELAVKSAKRIVHNNTKPSGSLDTDKAAQAILQYRNTPIDGDASPAQLLLHRQLRDFIPAHPKLYKPHKKWIEAAYQRERVIMDRNEKLAERYNSTAHPLPTLCTGDVVAIQNRQKRWLQTGRVVEVLPHRQYRVRIDGSGRITLRNRRFLRKVHPSIAQPVIFPSTPMRQQEDPPDDTTMNPEATPTPTQQHDDPDPNPPVPPEATPLEEDEAPSTGDPDNQNQKTPQALKRLRDFNKPGLKELP